MRDWRPLSKENDPNPWDPDCREPGRYHIRAAGTTEREVGDFLWGLVRVLQPRLVVETGTADGDTTARLGQALKENGHGSGYSIEFAGGRANRAKARLMGLPITVLAGDALTFDWSKVLPKGPGEVDFAFIDASTNRVLEFMWLLPYLAPKAIVAFHDTGNGLAVGEDVNRLAEGGTFITPLHIPCPRGLTVGRIA